MLYPISSPSRLLMDLSGIWDFQLDDGQGFAQKWYASPLPNPIPMPVPAAYNDLQEGLDFREHRGWVFYQRKISLPAFVRGQRVVLRCDAVTHHARVYLNGRLICEHQGGFLPFEAEITNWLLPGQENLLTIAADNTIESTTLPVGGKAETGTDGAQKPRNIPNFDYFNYSGIIRPVRLYTTPPDYIQDITLTAQLEEPDALLHYEIDTRARAPARSMCWTKKGGMLPRARASAVPCGWKRSIFGSRGRPISTRCGSPLGRMHTPCPTGCAPYR